MSSFGPLKKRALLDYRLSLGHPPPLPTTPPGHELEVIIIIFVDSDS